MFNGEDGSRNDRNNDFILGSDAAGDDGGLLREVNKLVLLDESGGAEIGLFD